MKIITVVDNYIDLLPHFLKHYSNLGVSTFVIAQHHVSDPDALEARIRHCSIGYDVIIGDRITTPNSFIDGAAFANVLRAKYVEDSEWSFCADLDEFHKYPAPVFQLIDDMNKTGCEYFYGELQDRLTVDGTLPETLCGDLDTQFPISALVTKVILIAGTRKLMLIKGPLLTTGGHHYLASRRLVAYPQTGIVYHFKWFGKVLERMSAQQQVRASTPGWVECAHEHDRLFRHCAANNGRIDLTLSDLHAYRV